MTDLFTASGQPLIIDRPYQTAAADATISYLKNHPGKNPIICAATGTGKSIIIARLIQRITKHHDVRIMMATHVSELVEQNAAKLRSVMHDADIGIYSAGLGQKDAHNKIVFAGIQSIYKNKNIGTFHVLIVDEFHTISRKDKSMWATLIATLKEQYPALKIIGLSATPFRLDSGTLTGGDDNLFDDIVFDYGLGRAVQDGYLAPLTAKATKTKYNIEGVGKVAGEYNLKQLEAATNVDELTREAVAEMVDKGRGRKSWLIFCNGIAHSFAVRDELRRHNITAETVTGETDDNERSRILEEFKSGKIRAVTNNAVWTTGVDVPGVDLIGMLRHTMSGGLLLQMAGRGTRATIDLSLYETAKERRDAIAASDKPNCLFLDFAGNIRRHGFLDQIKGRDKKEKEPGLPPMKDCPECFTICHAAAKKCPDCGYEFPVNTVQKIESAHTGNVLGGEPETRDVVDVQYFPHNLTREGKVPCLLVVYVHLDGTSTREYICLWHEGFAKKKADQWWLTRAKFPVPKLGLLELLDQGYCSSLPYPKRITVKQDGKYERIVRYEDIGFHNLEIKEDAREEIVW